MLLLRKYYIPQNLLKDTVSHEQINLWTRVMSELMSWILNISSSLPYFLFRRRDFTVFIYWVTKMGPLHYFNSQAKKFIFDIWTRIIWTIHKSLARFPWKVLFGSFINFYVLSFNISPQFWQVAVLWQLVNQCRGGRTPVFKTYARPQFRGFDLDLFKCNMATFHSSC